MLDHQATLQKKKKMLFAREMWKHFALRYRITAFSFKMYARAVCKSFFLYYFVNYDNDFFFPRTAMRKRCSVNWLPLKNTNK